MSESLVVELRPVGDGPPAAVRFRRALKSLLREHGLRAYWTESAAMQGVAWCEVPSAPEDDWRRGRNTEAA